MSTASDDMYDYYGFDHERDRYDAGHTSPPLFDQDSRETALTNEAILRWEHELAQPDYYGYFLDDVMGS